MDAEGRLVGINTAIITSSGGSEGVGFAVPINMARHVMDRLITGGKVTRGYLGIVPEDITPGLAEGFDLPDQNGALVGDVYPGTPAQKAGIKSGDVIIAFNGKNVADAHGLQLADFRMFAGNQRDGETGSQRSDQNRQRQARRIAGNEAGQSSTRTE